MAGPMTPAVDRWDRGGRPGGKRLDRAGHSHHLVAIPAGWPEVVAYRAGARLFAREADDVLELLRLGQPVTLYLTPEEVEAQLALPGPVFRRWVELGWSRAAEASGGEQ